MDLFRKTYKVPKESKMDKISDISILSGSDRYIEIRQLHRIFEENILSHRYEPAVTFDDTISNELILTYNELNNAANRIGAFLLDQINAHNLRPNQDGDWIIAVCIPPSADLIITLLAIWKTGAAYLPIDETFPKNRIDHILNEAKPAFVIYDIKSIELFGSQFDALSFDECKELSTNYSCENIADDQMLQPLNNTRVALVLYTSGSTGVPKGVRLPYEAVMNRLQWQWETFPYSDTEQTCVFKTALTFIDSVSEIWGPLLSKRALLVVPRGITRDAAKLVDILQKYKIERLFHVPTLLNSILFYLSINEDKTLLRTLKLWICSGETLFVSLASKFYDYFPETEHLLCNFYGSTEVIDVTYFVCHGKDQLRDYRNVPIGKPVSNTKIFILDANRSPVKLGQTGELFVSGANVAYGYVNGRDSHQFIEKIMSVDSVYGRLYQTGDYASVQKGGIVQYEGRTDSQVKIRGHRVDLNETQKHLLELDDVEKATVLCYQTGQLDQVMLAFVCIKSTTETDELQVEKYLRKNLPEYMIPHVLIIDEMPLLVNGKIDRQTLLKMYEISINNDGAIIEYSCDGVADYEWTKAQILFKTISDVVGRSARATISLKSNFFAFGGNSLNSIFTIAKLREQGYCIEVTDFLGATDLRHILDAMEEISAKSSQSIMSKDNDSDFLIEPLKMEHAKEAAHIIAKSFAEKGLLERPFKKSVIYSEYNQAYERNMKSYFLDQGFSFIIRDRMNRMIGVSLNNDPIYGLKRTEFPAFEITSNYVEYVEKCAEKQLPKGKYFHSDILVTSEVLSPQQNIIAIALMEKELIRLARENRFFGVVTLNSSPLTQQLAQNVFGYTTIYNHQINRYIVDGYKVYENISDSESVLVQWKKL